MTSRFTAAVAAQLARDAGMVRKERALLPLLQAAETAHGAALAKLADDGDWQRVLKRRAMQHTEFTAAVGHVQHLWDAMDSDGRESLAWVASFATDGSGVRKWLGEAFKAEGADVSYAGVVNRIGHLIYTLNDLAALTPEKVDLKRGPKTQLAGLRAAHAVFQKQWRAVFGKAWYPTYSLKNEKPPRRADNAEAELFLAFAKRLGKYNVSNCYTATGGYGDGKSKN